MDYPHEAGNDGVKCHSDEGRNLNYIDIIIYFNYKAIMSDPRITQGPDGHIIADCSANPFDVRPYVQAIMDRANFLYRENGKPVVILMGEIHDRGTNLAALQVAVKQAREMMAKGKRKAFLGIEYDYNCFFGKSFEGEVSCDPQHLQRQKRGKAHIYQTSKFATVFEAPIFYKNLSLSALSDEFDPLPALKMTLNDAAHSGDFVVKDDPATKLAVSSLPAEFKQDNQECYFPMSPFGAAVRNQVMAHHIADDIENSNCGFYVQQTGAAHLKGALGLTPLGEIVECGYGGSLERSLLLMDKFNVLSCYANPEIIAKCSQEGKQTKDNTIIALGLNQSGFGTGWRDLWGAKEYIAMRRIARATEGAFKVHI